MTFASIVLLALGVSLDAMAVAAARGMAVPAITARHVLLVAGLFGGAQTLMPLLGALLGAGIGPLVEAWDHWIAFALLAGIGAKMVWEARKHDAPISSLGADPFAIRTMLVLALATSVDALAVGVTLPLMHAPLAVSVMTIGVITAALSALGLFLGRWFGALLGPRLDLAGGLVLIGLGTKILLEHTHVI